MASWLPGQPLDPLHRQGVQPGILSINILDADPHDHTGLDCSGRTSTPLDRRARQQGDNEDDLCRSSAGTKADRSHTCVRTLSL
jgi:hypothetical protein